MQTRGVGIIERCRGLLERMSPSRCAWLILTVVLLIGPCATTQTRSTDYPQWRGLSRDGSASAFVTPASWPTELTRRWRVIAGEGYGTPLVVDHTIYTFTRG
jgi:hypothetical protein